MNYKTCTNRRAVAPIIATLLMVAIAVVGGILIFVFTQGFFADEQVVGPTVDNIRIFGYDARDGLNTIESHNTQNAFACTSTAANNLADSDCFTVFIENLGDKPVAIQSVRVFGETHTPSTGATTTTCTDTNGGFILMTLTSGQATEDSILDPNESATLCIDYNGNAVKPGRTIPVQIETSNGQSSQINIINGAVRGQNVDTTVGT